MLNDSGPTVSVPVLVLMMPPVPPTFRPVGSCRRFLGAVRKSGLLPAEHLDAQLRRCAAEGPAEDARELAARFVRDGLLTPFQVDQLLQGKWRNFVIAGKYKVLGILGA